MQNVRDGMKSEGERERGGRERECVWEYYGLLVMELRLARSMGNALINAKKVQAVKLCARYFPPAYVSISFSTLDEEL